MTGSELAKMLIAPLSGTFGAVVILIGMYSLKFNVSDAKQRNHPRAEKVARIGGWIYIAFGLVVMLVRLIF